MDTLSPLKSVLVSALGLLIIALMVLDTVTPDRNGASTQKRRAVRFDLGDPNDADHPKEKTEGALRQAGQRRVKSSAVQRQASRLLWEVAALAARQRLDGRTFRHALKKRRVKINLALIAETANRRTRWLDTLEHVLEMLSLAALIFLLGPLVIYKVLKGEAGKTRKQMRAAAWRSVPYFILTSAAVLVVANGVASLVVGIQKLQVALACFGTPRAAVTDAVLHFVIYAGEKEMLSLADLLSKAGAAIRRNPLAAVGLLHHLWSGLQVMRESTLLRLTAKGLAAVAQLIDLYGPVLAVVTLVVTYRILVPVLRNLVRYPIRALHSAQDARIWPFLKSQARVLWQELKAAGWMFVFIFALVAVAVVCVRLASFPVVVAAIRTLLASLQIMARTGTFPDGALMLSTLSLGLFLVLITAFSLLPTGLALSKTYTMLRAKSREKRAFRTFPRYWWLLKTLLLRIIGAILLAGVLIVALYFGLTYVWDSPVAHLYLPAVLFTPLFVLAVWRLHVVSRLIGIARTDPLALPSASQPPTP
jgi:hypothetical protein